ncbi:hypothetical protein QF047_002296 [Arthrobacter sp. W4I7]|nr:hypothetical protein [Arthrobacter sp. W4I7]
MIEGALADTLHGLLQDFSATNLSQEWLPWRRLLTPEGVEYLENGLKELKMKCSAVSMLSALSHDRTTSKLGQGFFNQPVDWDGRPLQSPSAGLVTPFWDSPVMTRLYKIRRELSLLISEPNRL